MNELDAFLEHLVWRTPSGEAVVTSFEKGVNSVSWVLIRFMLVMVPVVLFINGFIVIYNYSVWL